MTLGASQSFTPRKEKRGLNSSWAATMTYIMAALVETTLPIHPLPPWCLQVRVTIFEHELNTTTRVIMLTTTSIPENDCAYTGQ